MLAFQVNDMTCGHCVGAITRAVQAVDAQAQVSADLAQHLVQVQGGTADATTLAAAIRDAGYTPVAATPSPTAIPAARRGGCGCGSGGGGRCHA